jgi:hypothetical protein
MVVADAWSQLFFVAWSEGLGRKDSSCREAVDCIDSDAGTLLQTVVTYAARDAAAIFTHTLGRAMAQAVSRRSLTTEDRVRSQVKSM